LLSQVPIWVAVTTGFSNGEARIQRPVAWLPITECSM